MFKPLHIVSMTIRDSAQDSAAAEGDVLDLCKMVNEWFMEIGLLLSCSRASYTFTEENSYVGRRLLRRVRRRLNVISTGTWRDRGRPTWGAVKFTVASSLGSSQAPNFESLMTHLLELGLSALGGRLMRDHQNATCSSQAIPSEYRIFRCLSRLPWEANTQDQPPAGIEVKKVPWPEPPAICSRIAQASALTESFIRTDRPRAGF